MLKQLRNKKTAKKIWIVVAFIVILSFVLWGTGSMTGDKEETSDAGQIFGRKVTFLEYRESYEAVKNAALMQFGDKLSEIRELLNLEEQAWERLILLNEAKKRKIKVSDKEVIELIQAYPFFQHKGRFDDRLYKETLQYVFRSQPRSFEEQARNNLLITKLYNDITKDIKVTDEEITNEYKKLNEEISLEYILSAPLGFTKDISPSELEVKNYFTKNSNEFKLPVSYNLEYITLDAEDKVAAVLPRVNKKDGFKGLPKELGLTVKETGLFLQTEPIPEIGWSPEILNLVSKLDTGEVASPVLQNKVYYIVRLKEKKESYIPEFEKIKDKVKEKLIKTESENRAKQKMQECLTSLKETSALDPKGVDFTKTAKDLNLKTSSTANFKYGGYIEGIGASDDFWLAAKALKEGEFSGVIEVPSGYYVVRVKTITPIDEKKFAEEKEEFSKRLLSAVKQEHFSRFSQDMKAKAQKF